MAAKKELLLIEIREDGARVVKRNISDVGKAGTAATSQMDKLKTVLAGLVSAKVLKDTIMLADSYANMLNRLRVVTTGTWELHAAMGAVFQMSRETRTSLEGNIGAIIGRCLKNRLGNRVNSHYIFTTNRMN